MYLQEGTKCHIFVKNLNKASKLIKNYSTQKVAWKRDLNFGIQNY